MPTLRTNNIDIYYQTYGSGDETIVFSHGYLMSHRMFDAQIDALKSDYRIIAFDHRGHGGSVQVTSSYGMYDLVDDAIGVIENLAGESVHFIGMSTGGYVGVRLMVKRPELLKSVVLIDTAGGDEPKAALRQYNILLFCVRWFGIRSVYNRAIQILMGEKFRTDPARADQYNFWKQSILSLNNKAIAQFGKAIFGRDSVLDQLQDNNIPALIIVGEEDVPTPIAKAEKLRSVLANAQLVKIPNAGHTSPVEEPAAVTAAIKNFIM